MASMDQFMTPRTADWFMEVPGIGVDLATPSFATRPAVPQIHYEHQDLGANPMVQTFYEGPPKCDCCPNWVEKPPLQLPEAAKERYNDASLRLYKMKDHKSHSARIGGLVALKDDILELQGNLLVSFITPILAEVGFLAPQKDKITFKSPFRELYFAHPKIVLAAAGLPSGSEIRSHFDVLVATIEEIFTDTVPQIMDLLNRSTITFEHLWALFPKHQIVCQKDYSGHHASEVADTEYVYSKVTNGTTKHEAVKELTGFRIHCRYFSFDGTNFGTKTFSNYVRRFEGARRIPSLAIYPLGFHSNANLGNECMLRGQKILDLQDMTYCNYNGPATNLTSHRHGATRHLAGRVIVDPYGARKFMNTGQEDYLGDVCEVESLLQTENPENGDELVKRLPRISPRERRPSEEEMRRNREFLQANTQYLITMYPMIEAYSLTTNEWVDCDLDHFEPINWNAKAFDHLVLDQDYKDVLLTFCQKHDQTSRHKEELIEGKGNGLIVLLSGSTGTGKTLTVEAVADNLKRPLFRLQPDRLGSSPTSIGMKLQEAFELALHWKAILLLDEADSLLTQRSLEGGVRNEVVSVMLRQLEYYRGILFMTTNLFDNIDHAVRSRVRLHVQYVPLSAANRMSLWKTFLGQAKTASGAPSQDGDENLPLVISEADWKRLATWKVNGREIENVTKNVRMWCEANAYTVTLARLEKLIPLTAPLVEKETDTFLSGLEEQPRKRARTVLD